MKVLQLGDAAAAAPHLELHPQVTVVTGLDDDRRAWLVDVLGRLATGGEPGGTGRIEAHGIGFALDAASLALLDLAHPVRAIVGADDLPGHDPELARAGRARDEAGVRRDRAADALTQCRAALTTAVTERDDAARVLDELRRGEGQAREANAAADAQRARLEAEADSARAERTRADAALGAAVTSRDALVAERAVLQDRIEAAKARRRTAMAAATVAAAALEEARAGASTVADPEQAVQAAQTALAEAEAAASAVDPSGDDSPVTRRMADLERRRAALARMQVAMGPGESNPVAAALDDVLAASSEAPPVVAALALADTWRDLHQQIKALDAGVSSEERTAEERVAMSRQAVVEAESDFNQPVLTPEQIARVEAVHAEALEAQDRTEGRFGGARARKKLDENRNEERRVLERLGFSTYADYMMSASSRGSGPANRSLVEAARNQLVAAEAELQAIPGAGDRARRRTELLQRRDAVAPRVADLLGHEPTGPETEEELRNLREPVAPNKVAVEVLGRSLTEVGIDIGDAPFERDELVLLARSYLAEERGADAQREETEKALAALDRAVDELRSARNRGVVELPAMAPLPPLAEPVGPGTPEPDEAAARLLREARWAEVESARARLSEAQAEATRQRQAVAGIAAFEADLKARSEAEAEAATALAEAEAALGSVDGARHDDANDAVDAAESGVARARAAEGAAAEAFALASGSGADALVVEAQARADAAEAALTAIAADEQRSAVELAEAEAALTTASLGAAAAAEHVAAIDRDALIADVDWELMSRLAAVRSVGLAGSVPLVLDDPFGAFTGKEIKRVLDRVAQMAGVVQVIVVSDDDAVVAWAHAAGAERAAVLAA